MAFQGFLKQSTAVDILLGPFLDDTDGVTVEPSLTISQADVKLSKNGQALAQKSDATACSYDANGYYNCELDATDTNTVGQLTLVCNESGALPVRLDYHVVEEAVYNAMYGASAAGPYTGTPPTAAAIRTEIDSNSTQLAAIVADTNELQGDWTNGGRLDLIIDAIVADTNELQTNQGNWLTATGFSTHTAADVLTAFGTGSTLTSCLTATGFSTHAAADVWSVVSRTLTAATNITSDGVTIDQTKIANLDAAISTRSSHTAANVVTAIGTGSTLTAVPWNATWDAEVQSEVADALAAYNATSTTDLPSNFAAMSITAGGIVAADAQQLASDTDAATHLSQLYSVHEHGTAQGGSTANITLAADASATHNFYIGDIIYLTGGTGAGQARQVQSYNGASKVAVVNTNWAVQPDATSVYMVLPGDWMLAVVADMQDDVITAAAYDQSTAFPLASSDGSDLTALATASALATVDTNVDAILVDTNELQTNQGNWLTATGFSTHAAADVVTALGTGGTLTDCLTATGFSTHSAADVLTAFGTGSTLTACASADVSGLATAAALATLDGVTDNVWGVVANLNDTIEDNAGTYRFTTAALAQAPSGSTAVTITPLQSSTINSGQQNTTYLTAYQHVIFSDTFAVTDADDAAVDLSGIALTFLAWDPDDASTVLWTLTTADGEVSVGGASNNQVTVTGSATETATAYDRLQWRLMGTTNDTQYAHGFIKIHEMPDIPS